MCDQNNDCEYEGNMVQAVGPKDVYLSCVEIDKEIRIPHRLSVIVCPECGEPAWRTLC